MTARFCGCVDGYTCKSPPPLFRQRRRLPWPFGPHVAGYKINITYILSVFLGIWEHLFTQALLFLHACVFSTVRHAFGIDAGFIWFSGLFKCIHYLGARYFLAPPPSSAPTPRPLVSVMAFEQAWALRPYAQPAAYHRSQSRRLLPALFQSQPLKLGQFSGKSRI